MPAHNSVCYTQLNSGTSQQHIHTCPPSLPPFPTTPPPLRYDAFMTGSVFAALAPLTHAATVRAENAGCAAGAAAPAAASDIVRAAAGAAVAGGPAEAGEKVDTPAPAAAPAAAADMDVDMGAGESQRECEGVSNNVQQCESVKLCKVRQCEPMCVLG